jgi:hypothetical protein
MSENIENNLNEYDEHNFEYIEKDYNEYELEIYHQQYESCSDCSLPNTGDDWCQDCNSKRFQQDFDKWTSENEFIDKFIQRCSIKCKKQMGSYRMDSF